MSGFEIIGVVLAVVPLCTVAISAYESTMSAAKCFKRWRLLLPQYKRRLGRQHAQLELTIKILLLPILPVSEVEQMLGSHNDPRWKDPKIVTQLKARHTNLYPLIEETLEEITGGLKQLLHKLGLTKTHQVSVEGLESLISESRLQIDGFMDSRSLTGYLQPTQLSAAEMRDVLSCDTSCASKELNLLNRIQFAKRRKEVAEIFAALERNQNSLDALISKSDKARSLDPNADESSHKVSSLLQGRAKILYVALRQVLKCKQHSSQKAGLQLDFVSLPGGQVTAQSKSQAYHRFRLLFDQSGVWQKAEIHVCDNVGSMPSSATPLPETMLETVEQMCPTLVKHAHIKTCVGFRVDSKMPERMRGVYRQVQEGTQHHASELASTGCPSNLETMLANSNHASSEFRLRTRTDIAMLLTSCMQRLYTTDWFQEGWTKKDFVCTASSGHNSRDVPGPLTPYLLHDFDIDRTTSAESCAKRAEKRSVGPMLKFGILLMELWCGETIESYKPRANRNDSAMSESDRLHDWIEQHGGALPQRYLAAVTLCTALDYQDSEDVATALTRMEKSLILWHAKWRRA